MTDPRALAAQIAEQLWNDGLDSYSDDISTIERVLRAHQDAQSEELAEQIAQAMREKAELFRADPKARRAVPTAADGLDHFASDLEAGVWRDFLTAEGAPPLSDSVIAGTDFKGSAGKPQADRASGKPTGGLSATSEHIESLKTQLAACVQERTAAEFVRDEYIKLLACDESVRARLYAQANADLAACVQERDRLRTREATYHSLIAELHGLIDLEDHPDVAARADAVLMGDCENPLCALDSRLFHAEDRLREVEAERDRLRGALQNVTNIARMWLAAAQGYEETSAGRACVRHANEILAVLAAMPPTS